MLEKFHERYSGAARERRTPLLLLQSDIDRLPLEDASVDAVITCAVVLHNHKKITQRSLREVHRILKPGGRLIAFGSFLNVFNLTGAQGSAYLALLKVLGHEFKNGPVRYYREGEVRQLLGRFEDIQVKKSGFGLVPKSLLGFPSAVHRLYRRVVYNGAEKITLALLPKKVKDLSCLTFNVVAVKPR